MCAWTGMEEVSSPMFFGRFETLKPLNPKKTGFYEERFLCVYDVLFLMFIPQGKKTILWFHSHLLFSLEQMNPDDDIGRKEGGTPFSKI